MGGQSWRPLDTAPCLRRDKETKRLQRSAVCGSAIDALDIFARAMSGQMCADVYQAARVMALEDASCMAAPKSYDWFTASYDPPPKRLKNFAPMRDLGAATTGIPGAALARKE